MELEWWFWNTYPKKKKKNWNKIWNRPDLCSYKTAEFFFFLFFVLAGRLNRAPIASGVRSRNCCFHRHGYAHHFCCLARRIGRWPRVNRVTVNRLTSLGPTGRAVSSDKVRTVIGERFASVRAARIEIGRPLVWRRENTFTRFAAIRRAESRKITFTEKSVVVKTRLPVRAGRWPRSSYITFSNGRLFSVFPRFAS